MVRATYGTWLLLLAWTCFALSCESEATPTQLLVVVDSDLSVGHVDADALRTIQVAVLRIDSAHEIVHPRSLIVSDAPTTPLEFKLPLSFALTPKGLDEGALFRVVVTGQNPLGEDIAERQVITGFRRGASARLDMFLAATCLRELCRERDQRTALTCDLGTGACAPAPEIRELPRAGSGSVGGYARVGGDGGVIAEDGAGVKTCARDAECDDSLYCNGVEACDPGSAKANPFGCVSGAAPSCGVRETCDEASDRCTACAQNADGDDDHIDAKACGGSDCNDGDPAIAPGKEEICDGKDNDCDERTDVVSTGSVCSVATGGAGRVDGGALDAGASDADAEGRAVQPDGSADGGRLDAGQEAGPMPVAGGACSQRDLQACADLRSDTARLLRCDGSQWQAATCPEPPDNFANAYCVMDPGQASAGCIYTNVAGCTGSNAGANLCVGAAVHVCEANRSRLVKACPSDQPECVNAQCVCNNRCGGVCRALSSDPLNCGACGVDCMGGKCANGLCQPLVLSAASSAGSIAVDATHVYWSDFGSKSLKRVVVNGGAAQTIYANMLDAPGLAVDGSGVYWTSFASGEIMRAGLDGTGVTTLVSGLREPGKVVIDSSGLYWLNNVRERCSLMRAAKSGGAAIELAAIAEKDALALRGDTIYFSAVQGIQSISRTGGTPITLTTTAHVFMNITVDASSIYFTTWSSSNGPALVGKIPIAGGAETILANTTAQPNAIAVDGSYVYWLESSRLMRVATSGGMAATTIYDHGSKLFGVVINSRAIYLASGQSVLSLAKRP